MYLGPDATYVAMADHLGIDRRVLERMKAAGIPEKYTDEFATKADRDEVDLWPETEVDYTEECALEGCSDRFFPRNKVHLFCCPRHAAAARGHVKGPIDKTPPRSRECGYIWCHKMYPVTAGNRKFCCRVHGQRQFHYLRSLERALPKKKCLDCPNMFTPRCKTQVFCGKRCSNRVKARQYRQNPEVRKRLQAQQRAYYHSLSPAAKKAWIHKGYARLAKRKAQV